MGVAQLAARPGDGEKRAGARPGDGERRPPRLEQKAGRGAGARPGDGERRAGEQLDVVKRL